MSTKVEMNTVDGETSVTSGFILPVWQHIVVPEGYEAWELRMYSHQILGAVSVQIFWLEESHRGAISLYRNKEYVCEIGISPGLGEPRNIDEFKEFAWVSVLDQLTLASVHMANYIAMALKTNPGSEEVSLDDV